ncbi:histidinol-phosphatase [Paenibacillus allorhizosphaerae]|uniref:Histidinol-phosphatase n=1 Tax=Paenibacillus allorhizosphaerae TaxID=2849866 RepID=A0ABN7TL99_9BACL|nr:histidinol-phosphatase [Paenibacillus allorhizosphaerae]CAG7635686.1 Histidinol-phosphatase [Paenibacillus allorhizosphaerae]
MRIDYHTHHNRCGHAQGTLREMIEAAVEAGLDQIGLSDHSPLYFREEDHPVPGMTMAKSEFPNYVAEMIALREEYKGRIDVRLGVESDYIRDWPDAYREIYAAYPLDYVIGSVHYTDGFHVFSRNRWQQETVDVDETYINYIRHVQEAALCGVFDILGHIDAMKGLNVPPTVSLTSLWDETVDRIARSGVTVEINTSGLFKPCKAWFPSVDLIERLAARGVTFTFGSDAHSPGQLLHDWDTAVDTLRSLGVRELATFRERRRVMIPIPGKMM